MQIEQYPIEIHTRPSTSGETALMYRAEANNDGKYTIYDGNDNVLGMMGNNNGFMDVWSVDGQKRAIGDIGSLLWDKMSPVTRLISALSILGDAERTIDMRNANLVRTSFRFGVIMHMDMTGANLSYTSFGEEDVSSRYCVQHGLEEEQDEYEIDAAYDDCWSGVGRGKLEDSAPTVMRHVVMRGVDLRFASGLADLKIQHDVSICESVFTPKGLCDIHTMIDGMNVRVERRFFFHDNREEVKQWPAYRV